MTVNSFFRDVAATPNAFATLKLGEYCASAGPIAAVSVHRELTPPLCII
jgi:hypothetical protein